MLKRAQESGGTFVSIVLILAAIAVLAIILFVYVVPNVIKIPEREACKLSVIARSKTTILGMESDLPLNCKTNIIDIKKDGIYKGGEIEVRFKSSAKPSEKEEKVKKYIADQMYDCWYQFNQGKSDPWGDWHLGTRIHCMICADINFDSELSQQITKIEDFGEFLNTEKPSKISKMTYSEYLGGKLEMEEDFYIDTSQPHLVLYKLHDVGVLGGILGVSATGCGSGAAATAILNAIPGLGQVGWAAGVGVGCVAGFAGGVYHYIFQAQEVNLQANLFFVPTNAVNPGFCNRIG